jgi:hypothetical protein
MKRTLRNCCGSLALLLAATGAAAAQDDKDKQKAVSVTAAPAAQAPGIAGREVEEVFFQIRTPGTGEQLAFLRPGETLNIRAGTQIELFAVARPKGGRDRDLYRPQVRYSLPGEDRNEVEILEVEEKRGEVTLRALNVDPQRRQDATLHWRILDPIQAPAGLKSGSIAIDIIPDPNAAPVTSQPGAALSEREARALWTDLYRAILLREPDNFSGVQRLQRQGYPALLEMARELAESDESAIRVYAKGACNEQRLLSLYRHLWGINESQIPRDQWERYLDMMQDRRFDDVVLAFVDSNAFLDHHKLDRDLRSAALRRYDD